MTSLWCHSSFFKSLKLSISQILLNLPTSYLLPIYKNIRLHWTIKEKAILTTDADGHRWRSNVTKNELVVTSHKLLHSLTSYLVPRYNTVSFLDLDVRSTWRCLRSLNASCYFFLTKDWIHEAKSQEVWINFLSLPKWDLNPSIL